MGWLRHGLPLEEELAVEAQVRQIRACQDIEQLRSLAEQAFRAWVLQVDITGQLIDQLAEAEQQLEGPRRQEAPIEDWILEAAREFSPSTP
jgi:hypothetical protein